MALLFSHHIGENRLLAIGRHTHNDGVYKLRNYGMNMHVNSTTHSSTTRSPIENILQCSIM